MAHTSGNVANYLELLVVLRNWLVDTVGWTEEEFTVPDRAAIAVAIEAGGTGYAEDDVLTLTGGTFDTAAQLQVTAVSGGVVTEVIVTEAGKYSITPTDPVSCTGGSGSGATFNMSWAAIITEAATLSLRAPGNGVDARVYLNIENKYDVGNNFWGWQLWGATAYQAGIDYGALPGAGGPVSYNLWQYGIDYWFYANDRRVIVVAKCSTSYMSMYAGFFLPFALPSEYPFPYCLIGSYPSLQAYNVNNARNSMIADPGADGAAWYRRRTTETWVALQNQRNATDSISPVTGQRAFLWPHKTGRVLSTGSTTNPNDWGAGGFHAMKLNALNEAPLLQCHIIDLLDGTCVGALEGVYSTTGFNRSVEQQITVGGRTFRLFQRAFRNQAGDFFAVEEL